MDFECFPVPKHLKRKSSKANGKTSVFFLGVTRYKAYLVNRKQLFGISSWINVLWCLACVTHERLSQVVNTMHNFLVKPCTYSYGYQPHGYRGIICSNPGFFLCCYLPRPGGLFLLTYHAPTFLALLGL